MARIEARSAQATVREEGRCMPKGYLFAEIEITDPEIYRH